MLLSLGKMMTAVSVTIHQKAGENDQLFGSVTSNDVAVALEKLGYSIDRKKVHLEEPIKMLGDYKVSVRLHKDVSIDVPMYFSLSMLLDITRLLRSARTTTDPAASGSLAKSVSSWDKARLKPMTPTTVPVSLRTG